MKLPDQPINCLFFQFSEKNYSHLFLCIPYFFIVMLASLNVISAPSNEIKYFLNGWAQDMELKDDTLNVPKKIVPEQNGTIRLLAKHGRAIGPDIKYMPEWEAFGWFTAQDRVEWDVEVLKEGIYDIYLEWSVSDEEAGKPYVFVAGGTKISGIVGQTGSWEEFKIEKIGRVKILRGTHKMVFKPDSNFETGALLDLREIKLTPAK